jgi:hypothetical protein
MYRKLKERGFVGFMAKPTFMSIVELCFSQLGRRKFLGFAAQTNETANGIETGLKQQQQQQQ